MGLGEVPGDASERGVHTNHLELSEESIYSRHCSPERALVESPAPLSGCCGCPRLRIHELTRYDPIGQIPQLGGKIGS